MSALGPGHRFKHQLWQIYGGRHSAFRLADLSELTKVFLVTNFDKFDVPYEKNI